MGFSTANKNAVLDRLFSGATLTIPGTLHFGLSTTQPTDAGTNVTEPTGGSYARVSVTNNVSNFPVAVAGAKSNANDIVWPAATGNWGTVGWWVAYDSATVGVFHHWGTLQTARVIATGDTFRIVAGDLVITLRSG